MGSNAALDFQPNVCRFNRYLFKRGFIQVFGAFQIHAAQLCPAVGGSGVDRNFLPEGGVVRGKAVGMGNEQGLFIDARDLLGRYKTALVLIQAVFGG